ncbi:hypothetical protein [uncultured Shewanella sp.]|uniref:hypothetical protein n=1 Tax=uncultured Shewanella sp. TaxID=173975 RepID=UPI00261D9990|nr:hypothetical protein [uncultured Shewanella sp.]
MTDALTIKTHDWNAFNANIDEDSLSKISQATSLDEAKAARTIFAKITDWLEITHIDKAFESLYTLTHDSGTPLTSKQLLEKIDALTTLRNALQPKYRDNLEVSCHFDRKLLQQELPIIDSDVFELNIKLIDNEKQNLFNSTFSLGNYQTEMEEIKKQPLTNGAKFLSKDLSKLPPEDAIKHIEYVQRDPNKKLTPQTVTASDFKATGIRSGNLDRLNFNLLSPETLIKFSQEPKLVQEWVANQMKIFDFVGDQDIALRQTIMPLMPRTDLENHWGTHATQMINWYAKDNQLSQPFADEINQKVALQHNSHIQFV